MRWWLRARAVMAVGTLVATVSSACTVTEDAPPAEQKAPVRLSRLGESCLARNDCEEELACVRNVCILGGSTLEPTGKSCYRVECATDADCCKTFVPSSACPDYKALCDGNPASCASYHLLCECNRGCENEKCVDRAPRCASDAECPSLLASKCVESRCQACAQHGDCKNEGERCIAGSCKLPCTQDENCGLMESCQAGACVKTGCKSDRECAFVLADPRALCAGSECFVPCRGDWDCATASGEVSLDICRDFKCVFAGCESDTECRAALGLERSSLAKAVCR